VKGVSFDWSWGQEQDLDIQTVATLCPMCQILFVAAATASMSDMMQAAATAAQLGADVVSMSFGSAERYSVSFTSDSANGDWQWDAIAKKFPHTVFVAATGDVGYGGPSSGPYVPAAAGHVIAVGGTSLILDAIKAAQVPPGEAYAYIAGESHMSKAVKTHLTETRGFNPEYIRAAGYWLLGTSDAHEPH
jgi:subtilase family serine protease